MTSNFSQKQNYLETNKYHTKNGTCGGKINTYATKYFALDLIL